MVKVRVVKLGALSRDFFFAFEGMGVDPRSIHCPNDINPRSDIPAAATM